MASQERKIEPELEPGDQLKGKWLSDGLIGRVRHIYQHSVTIDLKYDDERQFKTYIKQPKPHVRRSKKTIWDHFDNRS